MGSSVSKRALGTIECQARQQSPMAAPFPSGRGDSRVMDIAHASLPSARRRSLSHGEVSFERDKCRYEGAGMGGDALTLARDRGGQRDGGLGLLPLVSLSRRVASPRSTAADQCKAP